MILNFDYDLPCRTSPRQCSRGSPGGWSWISFLRNLYINTKGKKYDELFINELFTFRIKNKPKNELYIKLQNRAIELQNISYKTKWP